MNESRLFANRADAPSDRRSSLRSGQPDSCYIVPVNDLGQFLRDSKKWWLTPIIVFGLLFGALVLLWGTDAGPFIYSVF